MYSKSVLELLEDINDGYYDEVKLVRLKGNKVLDITSTVSNSSRFNFSLVGVDSNHEYKTTSVIKDGKLSEDVDIIHVKVNNEDHNYVLKDMPLIGDTEEGILELVELLLKESEIDEYISLYSSLRKEYSTKETIRSPRENSEAPSESNLRTEIVPCVTYQIQTKLDPTIISSSLRESCLTWEDADREYKKYMFERTKARFRTRSLIYKLESSNTSAEFQWSEKKPLPRSKKKSFQETTLVFGEKELTIRRISWDEEITL